MSDDKTYTLGATAPTLETIRDFLRGDKESIQRDIDLLKHNITRMSTMLTSLQEHVDVMEEVTYELLDSTLKVNSKTTIAVIEKANGG